MYGAISFRYSCAISLAAWFTASFSRCSLRRSSGRSATSRSPIVIRSRGRSSVWRQTYSNASSSSRV